MKVGKERRKNGKGWLMGMKLMNKEHGARLSRALFRWLTTTCSSSSKASGGTYTHKFLKNTTERIKRKAIEKKPYLQGKYMVSLIIKKLNEQRD